MHLYISPHFGNQVKLRHNQHSCLSQNVVLRASAWSMEMCPPYRSSVSHELHFHRRFICNPPRRCYWYNRNQQPLPRTRAAFIWVAHHAVLSHIHFPVLTANRLSVAPTHRLLHVQGRLHERSSIEIWQLHRWNIVQRLFHFLFQWPEHTRCESGVDTVKKQ